MSHHQGVYQGQWFVGPTSILGTICTHFHHKSQNSQNVKIPDYTSTTILFFGPCISIIEGRTDQRNAQINFSLINLLLFKLLRHVSAT